MTTTVIDFVQSTSVNFTFQPVMNGIQYSAEIVWNAFGERYYLKLTDTYGNPVKFRSMVSSGPRILANFTWADNIAYVECDAPHNIPVGACARVVMSGTGTPFDGLFQVLAVSHTAITYQLTTNPQNSQPLSGSMAFIVNLVEGTGIGYLAWFASTNQFEYGP